MNSGAPIVIVRVRSGFLGEDSCLESAAAAAKARKARGGGGRKKVNIVSVLDDRFFTFTLDSC